MRVIVFSKLFPKYHPKAGKPTFFLQKILHSLVTPDYRPVGELGWPPKFHTIREGERWKVGDMFSARYWSDKPYRSKQEEFARLEIKKEWKVRIETGGGWMDIFINGENGSNLEISKNDGLDVEDFFDWFHKGKSEETEIFEGQIICWNDKIEYP